MMTVAVLYLLSFIFESITFVNEFEHCLQRSECLHSVSDSAIWFIWYKYNSN